MEPILEPIPLNSYLPLREIVYETLRDAIRKKIYKPGDRIMESKIADELKVSRTPVREAIRRLEQEGYLFTIYHRGTFVPSVTLRDIEDIYAIRRALEALACSLLAERIHDDNEVSAEEPVIEVVGHLRKLLDKIAGYIEENDMDGIVETDMAFHDFLYRASNNSRLEGIIFNLRGQLTQYRTVSMSCPGRLEATLDEHRAIVEAIAAGDVESARKAAVVHMKNAEDTLLNHFEDRNRVMASVNKD